MRERNTFRFPSYGVGECAYLSLLISEIESGDYQVPLLSSVFSKHKNLVKLVKKFDSCRVEECNELR